MAGFWQSWHAKRRENRRNHQRDFRYHLIIAIVSAIPAFLGAASAHWMLSLYALQHGGAAVDAYLANGWWLRSPLEATDSSATEALQATMVFELPEAGSNGPLSSRGVIGRPPSRLRCNATTICFEAYFLRGDGHIGQKMVQVTSARAARIEAGEALHEPVRILYLPDDEKAEKAIIADDLDEHWLISITSTLALFLAVWAGMRLAEGDWRRRQRNKGRVNVVERAA